MSTSLSPYRSLQFYVPCKKHRLNRYHHIESDFYNRRFFRSLPFFCERHFVFSADLRICDAVFPLFTVTVWRFLPPRQILTILWETRLAENCVKAIKNLHEIIPTLVDFQLFLSSHENANVYRLSSTHTRKCQTMVAERTIAAK